MASVSPGILVALTWETGMESDRLSPRPPCLNLHQAKRWGEPVTHDGTFPADGSSVCRKGHLFSLHKGTLQAGNRAHLCLWLMENDVHG